MITIKDIGHLKYLTKGRSQSFHVAHDADLGIVTIRYDIRSDRFIILNKTRDWTWGGNALEIFTSKDENINKVGRGLENHQLIMIEPNLIMPC
jgi:hypothetical protein